MRKYFTPRTLSKHAILTTHQRIERLKALISDAEKLEFAPKLIQNYKKQLIILEVKKV